MIEVNFSAQEISELKQDFQDYKKETLDRLKKEVIKTTLAVELEAKRNAPVDTGRLRASGNSKFSEDGLSGTVSFPVDYAEFQEFGTRYISPRLFLTGAVELERSRFFEGLKRALNDN